MRAIPLMLALGLVAGVSGVAAAGESPWTVKVGVSQVAPKSNPGELSVAPGAKVEISKEVNLTPAIEYKISDTLSAEVLLAIPFSHDIKVAGNKEAEFKHLPPTFTLKYNFAPGSTISPYVGLGLNYTLTWGEKLTDNFKGTKLEASDSFGLAATAGAEYRLPNSPWGVTLDIRYVDIDSSIKAGGNKIGTLAVDPLVVGLSAAYHF